MDPFPVWTTRAAAAGIAATALALLLGLPAPARAASPYAETLRVLLDERIGAPGVEFEIDVGESDPRLALAPCARAEPFIPPGARLSGRTSLGVRCVEGANWSIYLPVQIRLYVEALVVARPVARGQPMTRDDVRTERIDVAPLQGQAMLPAEVFEGRTATRTLAAGVPLRRDFLRAPTVFAAGDAVEVLAIGPGFTARSAGRALTAGTDGQTAQVALAGGRVLTGTARAPNVVEVR